MAGAAITREELIGLLGVDASSDEARGLHARARELSRRATGGRAFVLAQIGIDETPCLGNCRYCAFAAVNSHGQGRSELSVDEVVSYARAYAQAGANMVSLMSTDAYGFDRYVDLVAAVRDAIGDRVPIMANTSDFDLAGANALKAAGATTVYHAYRLGEGVITDIAPEKRLATIDAIRAAGLALSTGIGPVYDAYTPEQIADRMLLTLGWEPILAGVCRLTSVAGAALEHAVAPTREQTRLLNAIFRICAGTRVRFEYENVTWLDAGTDPRDHKFASLEHIAADVAAAKARFEQAGWKTCGPALEHFDPQWNPSIYMQAGLRMRPTCATLARSRI